MCIKYLAVPSSFITDESDHAHINITQVITKVFIPSTHISKPCDTVNIFLLVPITMATIPANKADWNKATDASALENASLIDTNDKWRIFK